eukprot:CAMPEP_0182919222 /NCGR_PEP_ID=MMETSP0105_2-20130417/2560_1 /TAXON_ID=81532 ORGANISM="Acanthoeca-like sp., Strain 10tr" /NCGR_SAMPLE_ID=MMETSP0105_2 /ASSEMBLY_ACC=CAM_ASM_000205 /LENGTH=62 /DNA_ID=CAMNT_0025056369 /DNA_START=11 /DNA_END=196 /DNA_ORIENTATION=-
MKRYRDVGVVGIDAMDPPFHRKAGLVLLKRIVVLTLALMHIADAMQRCRGVGVVGIDAMDPP